LAAQARRAFDIQQTRGAPSAARFFNSEDGVFALHRSDQSAPAGSTRQLGPYTILAVLIAAHLTRLGVPISNAALAGMKFAHTTGGSPRRNNAGALYSGQAITLLSINADGSVRIFPVSSKSDPLGIVSAICALGGATVIEVNSIVSCIEKEINDRFESPPGKAPEWR